MTSQSKTMRDALIKKVCLWMQKRDDIFFLSGDMGAPSLDELKTKFKDRFVNVGIAEQNLVNVSAGLALEDFIVYSYAIIPFLTMRAYEQIKNNVSLMSHVRDMNINLIGLGAGLSYDLSGPSHHAIEDINIMMALPNFIIFSPSDWVLVEKFTDFSIKIKKPKYARLDGKPLPKIYDGNRKIDFRQGFSELVAGERVCLIGTGFMTHRALDIANACHENGMNIGVIDVFLLKPLNYNLICELLRNYKWVITMEEGFINKCGLDSSILDILNAEQLDTKLIRLGFKDKFVFEMGGREYLHKLNGLDKENIIKVVRELWGEAK